MTNFLIKSVRYLAKTFAYGAIGGLVVLITLFVIYLENRPDLKVWHDADLDAEFTEKSMIQSFPEYLALEQRLFAQLDEHIYAKIEPGDKRLINRYHRGSLSDPGRWSPNWNRSFELEREAPAAGVLVLHGMSDSPYSLRNIGERLNGNGAWVVGLRLPGHGTAPSGLTDVQWEDMAAAVRLAIHHLDEKVGDRPLHIVGYSNGGALAVQYALSALQDRAMPRIGRIVLISPAIGVSPMAGLAVWQSRLGHILGLHKLEWNDILPEYDPFKYGSFAINAGDQVHRLTAEISDQLEQHRLDGKLMEFPPVLAFQSAVDATVSTPALIAGLMQRLPEKGHELVLFDVNREAESEHLLSRDPRAEIVPLIQGGNLPFDLSVVTNENRKSKRVMVRHKPAGNAPATDEPLHLAWPPGMYSLSHVALPFPEHDPLYGGRKAGASPGIELGDIALRGERGALQIPAADMLRLRWNPFYPYLEQRLLDFLDLPHNPDTVD